MKKIISFIVATLLLLNAGSAFAADKNEKITISKEDMERYSQLGFSEEEIADFQLKTLSTFLVKKGNYLAQLKHTIE